MHARNYKSLYECECEFLNRKLTFRDDFERKIIEDIQNLYSSKTDLVYVCQGPGGFLSDFLLLQKLIKIGFTKLDLIFVEPLLADNLTILQACLDFKAWCKEQNNAQIKTHFFMSLKEYAAACAQNPALRGDIFITIDPDDKETVPNFESLTFRKKFEKITNGIFKPTTSFYYLYFQKVAGNPYRHMLLGKLKQNMIILDHWYGIEKLEENYVHQIFNARSHPSIHFASQTCSQNTQGDRG